MEKEDKEKIERQCIKEVMEYFKNHILTNNSEALEIIRKNIEKVFKLEVEELRYRYDSNVEDEKNDILLKFVNKTGETIGEFFAYSENHLPKICIYESSNVYMALESENTELRLGACKTLFRALFHELQHLRQHLITKLNVSNKNALMYAKEQYLQLVLNNVFFSSDEKKGNYGVLATENNADLISWRQLKNLIQEDGESIEVEIAYKEDLFYNGVYKVNIDSKEKKKHFEHNYLVERIDALTEMVDETIDPMYIKIIPILLKEFNLDGTKKSATQLVKNLKSEIMQIMSMDRLLDENDKKILITDAKEMYYEIIYKALEKSTKKEITEMQQILGAKESTKILEKMIFYFNKEKEKRKVKRQIRFNIGTKKIKDENELAQIKASCERTILSICNYYDYKILFLSNLCKELTNITCESIAQDTVKANISQSEIKSVPLNEQLALYSLIINENDIDEER